MPGSRSMTRSVSLSPFKKLTEIGKARTFTRVSLQSGLSNPVLKRTVHAPDVVTAAAAVHVKVFCVFEVTVSVSVTPDPVVNTK